MNEQELWKTPASRRQVSTALAAGGVALLTGRALARAQDASPSASAAVAAIPPQIQAWVDAQNAHDAEAHAAIYAVDGVLEDVPNGSSVPAAQIVPFVESVLKVMGDIHLDVIDAHGTDTWGFAEYNFSATNQGLIPVPDSIGKPFTVRTATIFEFEGDKIKRSSDYYDTGAITKQLGLTTGGPMGGSPEATPAS